MLISVIADLSSGASQDRNKLISVSVALSSNVHTLSQGWFSVIIWMQRLHFMDTPSALYGYTHTERVQGQD